MAFKNCRICNAPSAFFFQDQRTFYKCPECTLIFTEDLPEKSFEEKHYRDQWQSTDPAFWKSQVDVLLQLMQNYHQPKRILDFGAGSGEMTRELIHRGYDVTPLEPMLHGYLKDQHYSEKFDVVIAVEVIEHLQNPWQEIREIEKILSAEGIVIFSTLLTNAIVDSANAEEQFKNWWYKDDPTHVSFFCNQALKKGFDGTQIVEKKFPLKICSVAYGLAC